MMWRIKVNVTYHKVQVTIGKRLRNNLHPAPLATVSSFDHNPLYSWKFCDLLPTILRYIYAQICRPVHTYEPSCSSFYLFVHNQLICLCFWLTLLMSDWQSMSVCMVICFSFFPPFCCFHIAFVARMNGPVCQSIHPISLSIIQSIYQSLNQPVNYSVSLFKVLHKIIYKAQFFPENREVSSRWHSLN